MSWLITQLKTQSYRSSLIFRSEPNRQLQIKAMFCLRAEKTNSLLEVSVLSWSVRVKEEAQKMPGESRSILHRNSLEKKQKWSCAQCTSDTDFVPPSFLNFPPFSFSNPRLCWRKHSPQGPADLSDCLQHPSGAYHHILLLQVNKDYFGSLLVFLPSFIFW